MSEFHHGVEVLFNSTPAIVREVRSAVTVIVGCAPIQDVHDTVEKRAKYINELILVRNRKEAAQFGKAKAGYNIPAALDAIFDESRGGTIVVINVFDPSKHKDAQNNPDPAKVTTAELTGEVKVDGHRTGLEKLRECYHHFGFFPKLILCDRSSLPAIRVKMTELAQKVRAHALVDIPTGLTKQQAVEARGTSGVVDFNTDSSRVIICYPHLKVQDEINGGHKLDPLSHSVCGAMIAQDLKYEGPNHSPSNKAITRALGTEVPILWEPGDKQTDTNLLNAAGIVTTKGGYATGIRTYGNRSAAYPTNSGMENFIHVQRILDAAHEAIMFYMVQYVDALDIPENVERVEEAVNKFLRKKIGRGVKSWFHDVRFSLPASLNTEEENADGLFKYKLRSRPVGVMERMTVISEIDLSLTGKFTKSAA